MYQNKNGNNIKVKKKNNTNKLNKIINLTN